MAAGEPIFRCYWARQNARSRAASTPPAHFHRFAYKGRMANLIEERVAMARAGSNPYVIAKMASGWCVIGDVQPLPG